MKRQLTLERISSYTALSPAERRQLVGLLKLCRGSAVIEWLTVHEAVKRRAGTILARDEVREPFKPEPAPWLCLKCRIGGAGRNATEAVADHDLQNPRCSCDIRLGNLGFETRRFPSTKKPIPKKKPRRLDTSRPFQKAQTKGEIDGKHNIS